MDPDAWPSTPPKRLLLVTDLSSGSDRALDRATQLALMWDAELLVVHPLEEAGIAAPQAQGLPSWRRPLDDADDIEREIHESIRGEVPRLRVRVEEGPAARVVLDAIEREPCDMVVIGLGRPGLFSVSGVGPLVEDLVRRSPVSVLVVKRLPSGPYRHVLVGTDLTPESRVGLSLGARLFPGAQFVVMHAFDMPYASYLGDTPLGRDFGAMERTAITSLVEQANLPEEVEARLVTLVEHGPPSVMLSAYVKEQKADLTVIGAFQRSMLFHLTVRGHGPEIVEAVPSDVLVVRA